MSTPSRAALRAGRRRADARMRSTIIIDRIRRDEHDRPITTTDDDGVVTTVRDVIYEGRGRVHYTGTPWPAAPDVAGADVTVRPIFVSIPTAAPQVEVGDRIRVLADLDTANVVGNAYRAIEPGNASQETAQRVLAQDYATSALGRSDS